MSRPTNIPRVFVDSSVFFAAARSVTGSARDLIQLAIDGRLDLVASRYTLEETRRNLAAKAPGALRVFETFLSTPYLRVHDPAAELIRRVAEVIVAKDAPIVAGAMEAQVDFLATYDRRHLLSQAALIQERFGVTVATPDAIISALQ